MNLPFEYDRASIGEFGGTIPTTTDFDNAREVTGWGPGARYLSRVIRLCLRYGVAPWFIPPARPQHNGSVENFNGWFQPRLFQRRFARPGAVTPRQAPGRLRPGWSRSPPPAGVGPAPP